MVLRTMGVARPRPFGPGTVRPRSVLGGVQAVAPTTSGYSITALAGAELAARQKDYPVIIANHCLRDAFRLARIPVLSARAGAGWVANGAGLSGADLGDAAYPVHRLWDGHGHRASRSTSENCDLLVDFGSGHEQTFDAIYVGGLSAPGGPGTPWLAVYASADGSAWTDVVCRFSAGQAYEQTYGPTGTAVAHARLGASTPQRFSGVRYLRFEFLSWGSPAQIGELWLGHSYQLPRHFDTPLSDRREVSAVAGGESGCALTARRVRNHGGAHLPAVLTLDGDTEVADAINQWWRPSKEGTWPVVLLTKPYTGAFGRLVRAPGSPTFDPVAAAPPGYQRRSLTVEFAEVADFAGEAP